MARSARPATSVRDPYGLPSGLSEPGWHYHATSLDRAFGISQTGMKTHKPWAFTDQATWPDGSVERRIYFSPRLEVVWQFAPEEGPHVVLRVHESSIEIRRERGTGDTYATRKIPAKAIEILGEDGMWWPLSALV